MLSQPGLRRVSLLANSRTSVRLGGYSEESLSRSPERSVLLTERRTNLWIRRAIRAAWERYFLRRRDTTPRYYLRHAFRLSSGERRTHLVARGDATKERTRRVVNLETACVLGPPPPPPSLVYEIPACCFQPTALIIVGPTAARCSAEMGGSDI